MWIYKQSTGETTHNNTPAGVGYAGRGEGRNNPAMQDKHDIGPCPRGIYDVENAEDDPKMGPLTMRLTPDKFNEMHGRAGMAIHGNNAVNDASHGCIILPRAVRQMISDSKDRTLVVIA